MIFQKELYDIAEKLKIQPSVIDKDWVLGHFLNAMYEIESIRKNFAFKGGTCLKKCYFGDYRYSEDLDFSLINENFVVDETLFNKIISVARKNSGADFYLNKIKPQIHNNIPQGYEVTIAFWGADHKPNQTIIPFERWQTKIKLDISFSELILTKPTNKKILHPYSDSSQITEIVPVYSMLEIISEKLRALIQRNRPRDIYDIWYIMNSKIDLTKLDIKKLLIRKADSKGIEISGVEQFVNDEKRRKNKRAWQSSLGHHLPIGKLPEFDSVYDDLKRFIELILKE